MKASFVMFFDYLTMMGVPILMIALAAAALLGAGRGLQSVLLFLIGLGSLVYGAIGVREAYVHGGNKRASSHR